MREVEKIYPIEGFNQTFLYSLLSAAIFLALGTFVLLFGHPHEDAYILYIYSEMLASNGVIQYFPGGPPAEGATDFLWMVAISFLNFIGVPSGYASLLLNALGVFLLSFIAIQVGARYGKSVLVNLAIAAFIPLYTTSQAAYAGFSVALYSALLALLFVVSISTKGKAVLSVSIASLLIALFRPDGAIIGALTCIFLFFFLDNKERKYHILGSSICALMGVLYFVWRWQYFGLPLPLPLIVKSHSDALFPGFGANLAWAKEAVILLISGLCALFITARNRARTIAMVAPIFVYFFAIIFAEQSQNVSDRFQAPLAVILILAATVCLQWLATRSDELKGSAKYATLLVLSVLIFAHTFVYAIQTARLIRYLANDDYINFFPYHLADFTSDNTTLALTEAGRFAYWLPGRKYDLVGLNTAEAAINGASAEYISALQPDLIFFHQAGTLPSINCPDSQLYCEISQENFDAMVISDQTLQHLGSENRVKIAPAAIAEYLTTTKTEYRIFAVLYGARYSHIYALREGGSVELKNFLSSLEVSFSQSGQLSYSEMIGGR